MTSLARSLTIDCVNATGRGLRLVMDWHRDRLTHEVHLVDGESSAPWLRSIEGDDSALWPTSPPIQQWEQRQTGRSGTVTTVMTVGLAGRSHWSVSFEALPDEGALVVDVACRHQEPPVWLGSTYQVASSPPAAGGPLGAPGPLACAWVAEAAGSAPPPDVSISNGVLTFVAQVLPQRPLPQTTRWKYRLQHGRP